MDLYKGYEVETDEGLSYRMPIDALVSAASIVPKENYRRCPVCDGLAALFFGDPDGKYWCVVCQIERDMLALQFVGLDEY